MASVDTGQVAQMFLRHRLTREQLVEALATMTACRQHHAVHALDSQPVDELVSSLAQHLGRFGVEGRPTFPRTEHYAWAELAADLVAPALPVGGGKNAVQLPFTAFEPDGRQQLVGDTAVATGTGA